MSDLKFMANFGRLLFWTPFKALGSHSEGTILRFARAKLVHSNLFTNKPTTDGDFTKTAQLAVLDSHLRLDYSNRTHPTAELENTKQMVAKLMRLAFSVPEHCNSLFCLWLFDFRGRNDSDHTLGQIRDRYLNTEAMAAAYMRVKGRDGSFIDAQNFFADNPEADWTSTALPQEKLLPYISLVTDLGVLPSIPGYDHTRDEFRR
ncbi:hypothetical protein BDP27DRAFT_1494157 [Rhodocollybia butyracea]|uniref:Uncharacterized protein n=1 Tax=Rhodocollybia butyracea TaxID=206335 RepID=A0A9P5PDV4_9AGAR|nr:hypothetical protein BDP27DRAFT_1494157 [Rhodocollybia butyracea]